MKFIGIQRINNKILSVNNNILYVNLMECTIFKKF